MLQFIISQTSENSNDVSEQSGAACPHMTNGTVAENAVEGLVGGRGGGCGNHPPTFLWALTSCTSFCDAASATEGAGGAGYRHQTSHPPQRHFNTSCLQVQRTQHPLTSTEALLSLRLSSVNNLGIKVLQEVLESFKLYNHRNDCLISEWRCWGCSQEQELNVLKSDLEGVHPCMSVFGVCCLCKIEHQLLLCWGWRGRLA